MTRPTPEAAPTSLLERVVGFATPCLVLSLTLAGFQGLAKDLDVLSVKYAQTASMIALTSVFCHWLATLVIGSVRRTTRR